MTTSTRRPSLRQTQNFFQQDRPSCSSHAERTMDETRLGRVIGPARAPVHWQVRTHAIHDVADMDTLVEATSFAIIREDENGKIKIRRGEDWRRSSHNATVRAWDVPTHHTVDDFTSMPRRLAVQVFGHDRHYAARHTTPHSDRRNTA